MNEVFMNIKFFPRILFFENAFPSVTTLCISKKRYHKLITFFKPPKHFITPIWIFCNIARSLELSYFIKHFLRVVYSDSTSNVSKSQSILRVLVEVIEDISLLRIKMFHKKFLVKRPLLYQKCYPWQKIFREIVFSVKSWKYSEDRYNHCGDSKISLG